MYTSHSIKQMARGVREGRILRNKRDRGETKREQQGRDLGGVEDKVTKEHTNKKAQVGKRFHEGGRL